MNPEKAMRTGFGTTYVDRDRDDCRGAVKICRDDHLALDVVAVVIHAYGPRGRAEIAARQLLPND